MPCNLTAVTETTRCFTAHSDRKSKRRFPHIRVLALSVLCSAVVSASEAATNAAAPGCALIACDVDTGEITRYDAAGAPAWVYAEVKPIDAWPLPDGSVLAAYLPSPRTANKGGVRLIAADKRTLFDLPYDDEIMSCQPLTNGHFLVNECRAGRVSEVNGEGLTLRSFNLLAKGMGHKTARLIRLTPQGTVLVAECYSNKLREYDFAGALLKEWELPMAYGASRLPSGNTLIAGYRPPQVVEVDPAGKTVWSLTAADLPAELNVGSFCEATRLPNGNTLVACASRNSKPGPRAVCLEVSPDKRVVWRLMEPSRSRETTSLKPMLSAAAAPLVVACGFENASPVWCDAAEDGATRVHLLYDHERGSPNRAAGHIHIRLEAPPGSRHTLEFVNLDNVWNGRPGSVARELKSLAISPDGRAWQAVSTEALPTNRVRLTVEMPGPQLYVARVEPYRLSDLDRLLARLRASPLAAVEVIGRTVEGRELEIVRLGREEAPQRVFLRARAHPWESGGNWVLEGLFDRLLAGDEAAARFLQRFCVYALPLANKDGVARGLTRFNLRGKDLNREWDRPADPELAPENAALEAWLDKQIRAGRRPDLALDFHNDGGGLLHVSRPQVPDLERHLARMARLEELLRKHTWFTEGSTKAAFRNPGSLGDGWLERFGVDAAVQELNCNWIAGVNEPPSARRWREYGAVLAAVFYDYFGEAAP
jgi:hypothetical protein